MTDLSVSPCRSCEKQAKVYCRARCKALKAYQIKASHTMLLTSYERRYDDDLHGITRVGGIFQQSQKLRHIGISDEKTIPLYKGDIDGPYQNNQA